MTLIKEMFLNQLYGDIDEPELKITSIFFLERVCAAQSGGACGQHKGYWKNSLSRVHRVQLSKSVLDAGLQLA